MKEKIGNMNTKWVATLAVLALLLGVTVVWASSRQSRYATAANNGGARVVFGPQRGSTLVKHVAYSCDKALGKITFKARSGNPQTVTSTSTTTINLDNTGYILTNDYMVVYSYVSGANPEYRTVATATTTNVVLSSAPSSTTAAGDKVYRVTSQGVATVGANGAGAGTNSIGSLSGDVFATPGNSPLVVELESSTNATLQVTVEL